MDLRHGDGHLGIIEKAFELFCNQVLDLKRSQAADSHLVNQRQRDVAVSPHYHGLRDLLLLPDIDMKDIGVANHIPGRDNHGGLGRF